MRYTNPKTSDVEARRGDSGGPIFNQAGELAGVLFGAGQGTTLGSFAPRVRYFLSSVAPDIDQVNKNAIAVADRRPPNAILPIKDAAYEPSSNYPSSPWSPPKGPNANKPAASINREVQLAGASAPPEATRGENPLSVDLGKGGWYEPLKTLFAAVGLAAITLRLIKTVR